MPVQGEDHDPKMPYQLPFPKDAQQEIVIPDAVFGLGLSVRDERDGEL